MIRAVIDPGVLVSAFISRGGSPPDRIVRAWNEGAYELIVSPHLLAELATVLARPRFEAQAAKGRADAYVVALTHGSVIVDDPADPPSVSHDPDDDYLFALARVGHADVIVSGDRHVLDVPNPVPQAVTPRAFIETLERSS